MRRRAPPHPLDEERATDCRARGTQPISAFVATARLQSVLIPGWRFLGALEKLYRMTWHDGRNGVLVDQLRMPIATQQHAEIIEPSDHALQLDAVHQEDGERNFGFADVVEEGVL